MDKTSTERIQEITNMIEEKDDKDLEDNDLPFLFRTLHSLAAKASCFFLQLGVEDFNQVESDSTSVDDAFVRGLQKWLNGTSVSRRSLVEAVFKPAGGNNRLLARELAKSFKDNIMRVFIPIKEAKSTSTTKIILCAGSVTSVASVIKDMLNSKVAARWYQVGVVLGSKVSDLEVIRMKQFSAQESEQEMFKMWLTNCEDEATWQRLVDAVGHSAGGNNLRLALALSEKIIDKKLSVPVSGEDFADSPEESVGAASGCKPQDKFHGSGSDSPPPPGSGKKAEHKPPASGVDSHALELQDLMVELQPLVARWRPFGLALRLSSDQLDEIEEECGKLQKRLEKVLTLWLKKDYDTKRFGMPSVQLLVEAVRNRAGGNNPALAETIDEKHKGKLT
jgi:hypothetical protein